MLPTKTLALIAIAASTQSVFAIETVETSNKPPNLIEELISDLEGLSKRGNFTLRKSSKPRENKGATLAFQHQVQTGTADRSTTNLDSDFFAKITSNDTDIEEDGKRKSFSLGGSQWVGSYTYGFSVEGHLQTSRADAMQPQDAIVLRAHWEYWFEPANDDEAEDSLLSGLDIQNAIAFEADDDFDTQKIVYSLSVTPVAEKLFLDESKVGVESPVIWTAGFGLDVGRTLDVGDSMETEDTVLRLKPTVGIEWVIAQFIEDNERSGIPRLVVYAENTFYYLPLEEADETYNLFEAGIRFGLTEDLGIFFSYQDGASAPNFIDGETYKIGLELKF